MYQIAARVTVRCFQAKISKNFSIFLWDVQPMVAVVVFWFKPCLLASNVEEISNLGEVMSLLSACTVG